MKMLLSVSIRVILQIKICSDIFDKSKVLLKLYGFSDILFAKNCPKDNNTVQSTIKLRSNITRRKANKTAECPYEHSASRGGFFVCSRIVNSENYNSPYSIEPLLLTTKKSAQTGGFLTTDYRLLFFPKPIDFCNYLYYNHFNALDL